MLGPALTVAPEAKLVPVKVTGRLLPTTPLAGLIPDKVGETMVKPSGGLVPPSVVTVTLAVPGGAEAAMVKVAVIWVALSTVTLLRVMLGPALRTTSEDRLAPVRVTGMLEPVAPVAGLKEVREGAGTGAATISMAETQVGVGVTARNWREIWPEVTETGRGTSRAWKGVPAWARMSKLDRTVWELSRTLKRRWPGWENWSSANLRLTR